MILHLDAIKDKGDFEKERLVFDVLAAGDLTHYLVAQSVRDNDRFDVKFRYAFWFTDAEAKPGDRVILYSKAGDERVVRNDNGRSSFFYFWHRDEAIWEGEDLVVVLVQTADFNTYANFEMHETIDEV